MNASALSPREALLYRELEIAAAEGAPCPSNVDLSGCINGSASEASNVLRGLELKGFVHVERSNRERCVTIIATGKATAPVRRASNAAPVITGADLAARLHLAAFDRGISTEKLCEALSAAPRHFIHQLERATKPNRLTIERVTALLEGREIPPQPPRTTRSVDIDRGPSLDAIETLRVDRDPCPRCGIRRDIGCSHTARAVSSRISL